MNLIACLSLIVLNTSIYSLQFQDIDGNTKSLSQYEGKRILFVNIASGSSRASQLAGLQQLHQQHGDSLVIIGFPSNSFGHEPLSNSEIKQFCQNTHGVTFLLASKSEVTGTGINPVYNWLTKQSENGVLDNPVLGNYQKFLVSKTGVLIGVFSSSIGPENPTLTEAISIQYN